MRANDTKYQILQYLVKIFKFFINVYFILDYDRDYILVIAKF